MHVHHIVEQLQAAGAQPLHVQRVLRCWVQNRPLDQGRRPAEHFLPASVRERLTTLWPQMQSLARLRSEHPGDDGSARLLVDLPDGQAVESVLLPREGLCISSQVGCAVGCVFCMTGREGLLRQLSSGEMVAQVALARTLRPVRKVVFMGMGEPAHNLDAVMEAIETLGLHGNLAHKQLVFSTVGDERAFERLPLGPVKPALALSLHTTRADLRAELLPRAPRIDPVDLVEAGERYARATGYPIQYQWTLIEGVNDGLDEMEGIVRLLKGRYALMNLIPWNAVPELPFQRPSWDRAAELARWLHQRGVLTKLRQSAGQDVEGGCGQLRARAEAASGRPRRRPAPAVVSVVRRPTAPAPAPDLPESS